MANLKPTTKKRKLTAAGYDVCAQSLKDTHPNVAGIVGYKKQLDRLETVLSTFGLFRVEEQLNRIVSARMLPHDAFDAMLSVADPTKREAAMADYLNSMNPTGTAEWVFEVFPDAKAHFCRLLIDAGEAETVLRDMTANYNYTGIDHEEIPALLSFVNDFCNILRPLAMIQEKRERALRHVAKDAELRKFETEPQPQRA